MIREFNDKCDQLFIKGRDEFGAGMDDARQALNAVGWGGRPDALAALIQLPDGHRVYRQLAANLDNAARILTLPPMGIMMELARMSGVEPPIPTASTASTYQAGAAPDPNLQPPQVSQVPEPLRTVGGHSARPPQALNDPKMPLAEFFRRRDKEERRSRISR